ncbi:hypothetical protein [Butyrivibrio sp. WCD3002]|uniref:hypothetical protein n=1 Tax=Butyrivibrio sp. WCD3002 TaxID=1280676 RepID=UPI0003F64497|nr:hypothetical protein [Butyrivibrio sp. WCD3002]
MKGKIRRLINILLATLLAFAIFTSFTAPVEAAGAFTMATKKTAASLNVKAGRGSIIIYLGDAYNLKCSLKKPTWSSSDKSIIRVDAAKNVLYAVGEGTATLTAKQGKTKITRKVQVQTLKGLTINNTYAVTGGAEAPMLTVGSEGFKLQSIITYHWNDGKGKKPGTISLYKYDKTTKKRGKKVATFKATGLFKNTYWNITCNKKLAKGYYLIVDSNPKTWSQNSASNGLGFTWIYYTN